MGRVRPQTLAVRNISGIRRIKHGFRLKVLVKRYRSIVIMLVLAGTIGEIPRRFGAELPDLHLSSIHFMRYEDPPVVIPTVTVKGQNGRTVRGLIYAYAWGRRIKHGVVPPHFVRWPMVRLGDQTQTSLVEPTFPPKTPMCYQYGK
jgi:hypothetical protein